MGGNNRGTCMVRKTVFSREDVVAAAVAVVAQDGLGGLSARRIAEELGSSTAPVYSNFANMETLAAAVKQEVSEQLLACTEVAYSDNAFLNFGIGVLEFAREKPGLYSAVFMQAASRCEAGPRVMARLAERMAGLEGLADLPAGERVLLLHQMAIFTHGLAVQICAGLAEHLTFADLISFMQDAGETFTSRAQTCPVRTPEQLALIRKIMAANAKDAAQDDL
jgi:AcrR family transcriptional regulator